MRLKEPVFPEEILFLLVLHFVRPPAALCVAMRTGKPQKKNFFRKNVHREYILVELFGHPLTAASAYRPHLMMKTRVYMKKRTVVLFHSEMLSHFG